MRQSDLEAALAIKGRSEILFDEATIKTAIADVAKQMTEKLKDKNPLLLCVMNGAVVFMGQLTTQLHFPLQIDYVHATRYQGEIEGREIHWVASPHIPLTDRTVVIVEDILDGGLTMAEVKKVCQEKGAKEIFTATLVNKEREREVEGVDQCDFVGLNVGNDFVIGYGLDYKGYLRNEPTIRIVRE